jgi:TrmH family RNA methyltransferase
MPPLPKPIKIDSQRDPLVRLLQALTTPTGRAQERQYIVEGAELIRRAFTWGAQVQALAFTDATPLDAPDAEEIRAQALTQGLAVHQLSAGLMGKILGAKPTPPCVAVVARRVLTLADMIAAAPPDALIIAADCMENADNLGMFLRSAEAAGVHGVLLGGVSVEPFNRKTVRGSRGALFRLPLCIAPDTLGAIQALRAAGFAVIATSAQAGALRHTDPDYTGRVALLVGNEHAGLPAALSEAATCCVKIPMAGQVSSLNVAVAASVALYEAVRQRQATAPAVADLT